MASDVTLKSIVKFSHQMKLTLDAVQLLDSIELGGGSGGPSYYR